VGVYLPPFQRLLDDHGASLLRFLSTLVPPDDVDDCFQDTVLAALAAYPRLRHADNLRAWLFTVARNTAIDAHRSRARTPIPSEKLPDRGAPEVAVPDAALWDRVRALPERQRVAVCLRYAGDLAYADVARVMGSSPEAARQNVHAGLTRLREEMG